MKMITGILLAFIVALVVFPSVSDAAVVGDRLTTPEKGWSRYDNTEKELTYKGDWRSENFDSKWNKTQHYTEDVNATVSFIFYGTKLRLVDFFYHSRSKEILIEIDGVVETYSQYAAGDYQIDNEQRLSYEKLGLPVGFHKVVISNSSNVGAMSMDAIDIDENGYLVNSEIDIPVLSAHDGANKIQLNWSTITGATSYHIKRSTSMNGPFETIAPNVTNATTFSDNTAVPGVTYYYVVAAINAGGEGVPSNVASATIPVPDDGRAILVVTMTTGLEKEYDLSMQEVNSFIEWYEAKQEGTGKASYAINKHDNNKGPFKSRMDYMLFDRILTFEVNEY
jgi:hypothetical protein